MTDKDIKSEGFHIYYSPADAFETGYGWVLFSDGCPAMLFGTKELALAEVTSTIRAAHTKDNPYA